MKGNVSFQIFAWAIGIVIVVVGWMFTKMNALESKVDVAINANNQVLVQLSQIQTDILWIKDKLK
ncbi:MAG: hypothetical protein KW793_03165 [Candidatus Doudnabacteria bacterium]|nr:hypothetical protein [Candidatus Doudnabacteria bacterium]